MRSLITLIAVFVCGLMLVLWLTHRTTPMPAAPTRIDNAIDPASMPDKVGDKLTPADGSTDSARVASSTTASMSEEKPRDSECRVFGRVIDEHGAPLADVQVSLYPVGGRWSETTPIGLVGAEGAKHEGFAQHSASDGRFEFHAPLPTADWVSLEAVGDLHRSIVERRFGPASYSNKPRLSEGDNDVGDLRLEVCGAVRGRVLSPSGAPIAKVRVAIPESDA